MDLTTQFVQDYRKIASQAQVLNDENASLRARLERLEKAAITESSRQIDAMAADRDRLKLENDRLKQEVSLWRRRYDDLCCE